MSQRFRETVSRRWEARPRRLRSLTTTREVSTSVDKKKRLPPIHPGAILREESLAPLGVTASELSLALRVPQRGWWQKTRRARRSYVKCCPEPRHDGVSHGARLEGLGPRRDKNGAI